MSYVLEIEQTEHVNILKPVIENLASEPADITIVTDDGQSVDTHKLLLMLFSSYLRGILGTHVERGHVTGMSAPVEGRALRNLLKILVDGAIFGADKNELLAAAKCGKTLGIELKNLQIGGKKNAANAQPDPKQSTSIVALPRKTTDPKVEFKKSTTSFKRIVDSVDSKESSNIKSEKNYEDTSASKKFMEGDKGSVSPNKLKVKTQRKRALGPCINTAIVDSLQGLTNLSIKQLRPEATKHGITLLSGRKKKEQVVDELWQHYLQFHTKEDGLVDANMQVKKEIIDSETTEEKTTNTGASEENMDESISDIDTDGLHDDAKEMLADSVLSENMDEDDGDHENDGKMLEVEKLVNEGIANESNDDDFVFE